jgi:hypothetical protein
MIAPHTAGHAFAPDGRLVRVDVTAGRWVATRFAANLVIQHQVCGSDELVHQQVARWLSPEATR